LLIHSSCDEKKFYKEQSSSFHNPILVYAKDSTGIFTYNPHTGENKQIQAVHNQIVPETFKLINDSLLTFTTLESMKMDSVELERQYTDSNNVVQSYLSTTFYWVVKEKVHLISLSDGRHYVPQVNEYYVHDFHSRKFTTYGFQGIMTLCVSDTLTDHGRYYINDDSCERYVFELELYEKFMHLYSESKMINGVKLVTYDGNLILMNNGHVAGIHYYKGTFSQKAAMIGYYSPDISENGSFCTYFYKTHLSLNSSQIEEYPDNGVFICERKTGKKKRIAGLEYVIPKLSADGEFLACGSRKKHYTYDYTKSELITVFDLATDTHVCIGEGQYYEWANYRPAHFL